MLLPKLAEKAAIGRACVEFDTEAPLAHASSNEKRRLEGKTVCGSVRAMAACLCKNVRCERL